MAAYKDEERGTWYVSFYYEDWTGAKKRKVKRGFRTKKEALNFEAEYKRTAKADMDMTMGEFVEVYFRDKSQSLKDRSIKNKRDTMNAQLLPYFKDRPMNSITPAEIICQIVDILRMIEQCRHLILYCLNYYSGQEQERAKHSALHLRTLILRGICFISIKLTTVCMEKM